VCLRILFRPGIDKTCSSVPDLRACFAFPRNALGGPAAARSPPSHPVLLAQNPLTFRNCSRNAPFFLPSEPKHEGFRGTTPPKSSQSRRYSLDGRLAFTEIGAGGCPVPPWSATAASRGPALRGNSTPGPLFLVSALRAPCVDANAFGLLAVDLARTPVVAQPVNRRVRCGAPLRPSARHGGQDWAYLHGPR